jgi:hypothetical protein
MKKLFLLLLVLSTPCFATSQIQINARKDNGGVIVSYDVITWNGPNQDMITTKYTPLEAAQKFPNLISKSESGLSKASERIIQIFNDDGSINKVEFQVVATKFERVEKPAEQLSASAVTDCTTIKADVETKTGTPINTK